MARVDKVVDRIETETLKLVKDLETLEDEFGVAAVKADPGVKATLASFTADITGYGEREAAAITAAAKPVIAAAKKTAGLACTYIETLTAGFERLSGHEVNP